MRISLPWLALAAQVQPKGHPEAHFEALKLTLWPTLAHSLALSGSLRLTRSLSGSLWLTLSLSLALSGSLCGSLWLTWLLALTHSPTHSLTD